MAFSLPRVWAALVLASVALGLLPAVASATPLVVHVTRLSEGSVDTIYASTDGSPTVGEANRVGLRALMSSGKVRIERTPTGTDWAQVTTTDPSCTVVTNAVECSIRAGATAAVQITGGSQNDSLTLVDVRGTVNGSGGADAITGSSEDDVLYGGDGNDYIDAQGGMDSLYGGDGVDTLEGGDAKDLLIGGKGPDVLDGQGGTEDVAVYVNESGVGRQSLDDSRTTGITVSLDGLANDGSAADDEVGGSRDNVVAATEWVWGTRWPDRLIGSDRGGELLNGWSGDDYLDAKGGDDRMLGDSDDDVLVAEDGAKDSEVNCDNSGYGVVPGTLDVAAIDSVDRPYTSSCETVNEAGASASTGTGSNGPESASGPSAPAGPNPASCATSIRVGPLKVDAEVCMARDGMVWTATGKVTIGGLNFLPNGGGAKLIIDPLNLSLRTKGSYSVVLEGRVGGTAIGPATLYSGEFTWAYQWRPELKDITGVFQAALPGDGVSLASIARLPGLTNASSLPQLPATGLPDYSAVRDASVKQLMARIPSLGSREVSIDLVVLGMSALPTVRIGPSGIDWGGSSRDQSGALFGLPVSGAVEVQVAQRGGVYGSQVRARLALPSVLSGVTANAELFIGQNGSITVISAGSSAAQVGVPPLYLAPLALSYDGSTDTWSGDTRLFFGVEPEIGFGGTFVITRGVLQSLAVRSAGIPAPFGPTAVFDQLDGTVVFNPLNVTADVVVGFGPKIPALDNAKMFSVDGRADYSSTEQRIRLTGGASSAGARLVDAEITYWFNGTVEASGRMSRYLDADEKYGFSGEIKGAASSTGANLEGNVLFSAPGFSLGGSALVSTRGVAACAEGSGAFRDVQLGAGYKWGDSYISFLTPACDFGEFRARVRAARSAGPQAITVGRGEKALVVRVRGAAGPPRLSIVGPGGRTVESPADNQPVKAGDYMLIPQPADRSTYVAIAAPAAGRWTITPLDGADIEPVAVAPLLPPARVRGSLANGQLRFTATKIAGQVIRFTEQGRETSREIGTSTGASGSIRFTPMRGPAGPRTIIATVEQDGMPRARFTIARFRAKAPALAAPKVRLTRGSTGGATVRWTRVPGARRYEVLASYNGASYSYLALRNASSVQLPDVLRTSPVAVKVRAVADYPTYGPYGTTTMKKAKRPTKKKPGRTSRTSGAS